MLLFILQKFTINQFDRVENNLLIIIKFDLIKLYDILYKVNIKHYLKQSFYTFSLFQRQSQNVKNHLILLFSKMCRFNLTITQVH